MTEYGHLKTYTLTLTTKTPLYIGSGNTYQKTDYVFNGNTNEVSVLDINGLFSYLAEKGLGDQYENFILVQGKSDMVSFFRNSCRMDDAAMRRFFRYTVSAGDALDRDHSLKEIHSFVRNSDDRVYIPGSSVKGAIRTALLFHLIGQEGRDHPGLRLDRREKQAAWEKDYLSKLFFERARRQNDIVNDIMRGVVISDSTPVDDGKMTLSGKVDAYANGETNRLNLCRECVRPGVSIPLSLTLDESVLHGSVTAAGILGAIREFADYYEKNYAEMFDQPRDAGKFSYADSLVLGGGAGFFSKTLTYPYVGDPELALEKVIDFFCNDRQMSRHRHDEDTKEGISPHMWKYGQYNGRLYPYGLCGVTIG